MNWASADPVPADLGGNGRDGDPELTPLICVACGFEMDMALEPLPEICPQCQQPIDLRTQLAFSRGLDAFSVGQDILILISPKMRRRNMFTEKEREGILYYTQAYNSLQLAFQGRLAESQRSLGIEMMASIVNILQQHQTVSEIEFAYWGSLMKELHTQEECEKVQQRIAAIRPGFFAWAIRTRWHLRLRQLQKYLRELNDKIARFEKIVRFAEPLNARIRK